MTLLCVLVSQLLKAALQANFLQWMPSHGYERRKTEVDNGNLMTLLCGLVRQPEERKNCLANLSGGIL